MCVFVGCIVGIQVKFEKGVFYVYAFRVINDRKLNVEGDVCAFRENGVLIIFMNQRGIKSVNQLIFFSNLWNILNNYE